MMQDREPGNGCNLIPPFAMLAIDTTFAACSAAVRLARPKDDALTFVNYREMASGHAESLMGMIDDVLAQADMEFAALTALAVTVGPGSFTGTRLGIAAVRGLALATGLPIYAASSLAAIGWRTIANLEATSCTAGAPAIAVCVDARREQIYFQIFSRFDRPPITAPQIASLDELAVRIQKMERRVLLIASDTLNDNIADALNAQKVDFQSAPRALLPSAEYLLDVRLEAVRQPKPIYLRPCDAKAQDGKAIARQPKA